jgi:hypothetical protein
MLTKCPVCEQRKKDEQCEGFSNKETWAVALHLDNVRWIQEAYRVHRDTASDLKDFADRLKNMLENWQEDFFNGSQFPDEISQRERHADLVHMFQDVGSLWRVDWKELAEHLLKD